jgi:hypothetical protein
MQGRASCKGAGHGFYNSSKETRRHILCADPRSATRTHYTRAVSPPPQTPLRAGALDSGLSVSWSVTKDAKHRTASIAPVIQSAFGGPSVTGRLAAVSFRRSMLPSASYPAAVHPGTWRLDSDTTFCPHSYRLVALEQDEPTRLTIRAHSTISSTVVFHFVGLAFHPWSEVWNGMQLWTKNTRRATSAQP